MIQICLMTLGMPLRRSDVQLSNTYDVNIFLHLSASYPDGPDLALVLTVAFLTNSSFMSSKIIE